MIGETQAPDPFLIAKSKKMNKRLALNVGGIRLEYLSSHIYCHIYQFIYLIVYFIPTGKFNSRI